MKSWNFFINWVFLNLIGFVIGSLLGATSNGLVPSLLPGFIGFVLGDLIFGATIGLFQWLLLRRSPKLTVSVWWILATSIGFTLGARLGAFFTYQLTSDWMPPSVVFGIFMGGSIGLSTLIPLSHVVAWPRLFGWLAISLLAWILGETIAFSFSFSQSVVPLIAITIGSLTGLELLRLQKPRRVKLKDRTSHIKPEMGQP